MSNPKVIYVQEYEHYVKKMPYSEVMMHMKLAGKKCRVSLLGRMAYVYPDIDKGYHTTVTPGEAGLYYDQDKDSYYFLEDDRLED